MPGDIRAVKYVQSHQFTNPLSIFIFDTGFTGIVSDDRTEYPACFDLIHFNSISAAWRIYTQKGMLIPGEQYLLYSATSNLFMIWGGLFILPSVYQVLADVSIDGEGMLPPVMTGSVEDFLQKTLHAPPRKIYRSLFVMLPLHMVRNGLTMCHIRNRRYKLLKTPRTNPGKIDVFKLHRTRRK